ncbi:MAG: hypothetical protein ABI383_14380, partial [Acidobacteriaceae bacterium]
ELMLEEFAAPTGSQQQTDFQYAQWSVLLPTLVLTPSQSSDLSTAMLFASNHRTLTSPASCLMIIQVRFKTADTRFLSLPPLPFWAAD